MNDEYEKATPATEVALKQLVEASVAARAAGEAPTEYVRQVSLPLSVNNLGPRLEIEFPDAVTDIDEANPLHVLAWYYAHAAEQLMPVAIQSWHLTRASLKEHGGQ